MTDIVAAAWTADLHPPPSTRAMLFDWDGTLFDNHDHNFAVLRDALTVHGVVVQRSWFIAHAGLGLQEIIERACRIARRAVETQAVIACRNQLAAERIDDIAPMRALHDLVHHHRGLLPMGVVTGSPRSALVDLAERHHLDRAIGQFVTCEDVAQGRPHPDGYVLACRRFGVSPATVQVFEDSSEEGIAAPIAAGVGLVIDVRPLRELTRGQLTAEARRMLDVVQPWLPYGGPPYEDILVECRLP
jgi:HAD superfamily hydrolase (TIGR01509 family)